jgi:MoxR-like ATPase
MRSIMCFSSVRRAGQDDSGADHRARTRRRLSRDVRAGDRQVGRSRPALLTNLEDGDVLFIDEIHPARAAVEEVLYPAMEDRALDLMIGEGPSGAICRIDLPRFTLVGATDAAGLADDAASRPFGIPVRLNFYTVEELEQVVPARRAADGRSI